MKFVDVIQGGEERSFGPHCRVPAMIERLEVRSLLAATPLNNWLVWGPAAGSAGLAVQSFNREQLLTPQLGDINLSTGGTGTIVREMIEWQAATGDASGMMNVKNLPLVSAGASQLAFSGGTEYLVSYLNVPGTIGTVRRVYLRLQSTSPNRQNVWLNGVSVVSVRPTPPSIC